MRSIRKAMFLCASAAAMAGCASTSYFHNDLVPGGSLWVGQVVDIAKASDIRRVPYLHDTVVSTGISDAEIHDGTVIAVRVSCCRDDPNDDETLIAYVPDPLRPQLRDIVEIRTEAAAAKSAPARKPPNTVTQIRESADAAPKQCHWEPDRPNLWGRRLHCDWMAGEGWIQQGGIFPVWIRKTKSPAPPQSGK